MVPLYDEGGTVRQSAALSYAQDKSVCKMRNMAEKRPVAKIQRVPCNSCRQKTDHRLLKTARGEEGSFEDASAGEVCWSTIFDTLQCCGCREVVLRRTIDFSESPELDIRYFPPPVSRHPPSWSPKIPRELRLVLDEVYRSLDSDTRILPMMGARALVDMLMVEKVGDVGGFKQKLKQLVDDGVLSARNQEVLDAALDAGSAAAHRGHAPSISEVNAVMDIVENLLQAVYVLPDMAQSLKKTTPPRPSKKPKP